MMKRSFSLRVGSPVLIGLSILVGACGSETAVSEAPAAGARRVLFAEPKDGATVKSPVTLRYSIEGYQLGAVPAGEVTTARAGLGHHHVAVDADCLPVGTVIPKATPWVHHGDGATEMQMQLPPGKHKLTLQLGDDLHTTMTDLCTSITVNVTE